MKKSILFLILFFVNAYAVTIIESPDEGHSINVSNRSVNRIVLPYKIRDLAYSKEKGLLINIVDNQAFIKYVPIQKDIYANDPNDKRNTPVSSEIIYDRAKAAEVFFITEGRTFSFNLIPKSIKTQTIIVNDYIKNKKEALKYETSNNYVAVMSNISKTILNGNNPKGYSVTKVNKNVFKDNIKDITLSEIHEGMIYKAYLFEVKNKTSVNRHIDIKDFFKFVNNSPIAITTFYDNEFNEFLPHSTIKIIVITKAQQ